MERRTGDTRTSGEPVDASCLRSLVLPEPTTGALFLTGMPEDDTRLAGFLAATATADLKHLVILTEDFEIRAQAPAYAKVLMQDPVPFSLTRFPIRDFGVPEDSRSFRQAAGRLAVALQRGDRMVMHCRGGIGRTGLMAQAVLIELGVPPGLAAQHVADAGSKCETTEQTAFLREAYADVED